MLDFMMKGTTPPGHLMNDIYLSPPIHSYSKSTFKDFYFIERYSQINIARSNKTRNKIQNNTFQVFFKFHKKLMNSTMIRSIFEATWNVVS